MNGDINLGFTQTEPAGVCRFIDRNYDSTSTYQIEYVNRWNNHIKPGVYDIKSVKYSQPQIKIKALNTVMPYACGEIMYAGYHPREPTSFTDLPTKIQTKIKRYFTKRVGISFYSRLVLNGGQIITLQRFHKIDTFYKADPSVYSLCYMVWDSISHTSVYNFSLKLDKNGKLLTEVPLPDIKHNPSKEKVITVTDAIEIAKQNNFYNKYTQTNSYYSKTDCIVWGFRQDEPGRNR